MCCVRPHTRMTMPTPPKELLALEPREEKEFRRKVHEAKRRRTGQQGGRLTPGVVYMGHLPSTLQQEELKAYLEQFGKVLRVRLARSKKTGGSKGYAFVEYECDEVAKIVAETMNNYLMGERLIKCEVVLADKVHERMFEGSDRTFVLPRRPAVQRYNAQRVVSATKLLRKEAGLRKRLAASGIQYDFPGFAAHLSKKQRSSIVLNESTLSDDVTPVCTPSLLARRKSQRITDDDVDEEVVVKMPAPLVGEKEAAASQ